MKKLFERYIQLLRNPLFIGIWLLLIIICAFTIDKPIALYCHQHIDGFLLQAAELLTLLGIGKWYIIITAIITLFAWLVKRNNIALPSAYLFLTVAVSGLICDVIKVFVSRARPIELFQNQLYGLQWFKTHAQFWSFPSGHSTVIAALAMTVSLLWPRSWLFCLVIALLVAASRVLLTAHYLSDVMAGLYLGSISSYYLMQYLAGKSVIPTKEIYKVI